MKVDNSHDYDVGNERMWMAVTQLITTVMMRQ